VGPACQPAFQPEFQFGTVTGTFSRKLPVYSVEFATLEIEKKSARGDLAGLAILLTAILLTAFSLTGLAPGGVA
jgi:hypothetical protein